MAKNIMTIEQNGHVYRVVPEPVQENVSDSVETEDERYTRLRKERLEWQKNHPNKW